MDYTMLARSLSVATLPRSRAGQGGKWKRLWEIGATGAFSRCVRAD